MIARSLLVCSFVLLGCGSSEPEPEPQATDAGAPPPARSPEEVREILYRLWTWPADKGSPRDVEADNAACEGRLHAEPGYGNQPPLRQFLEQAKCMQDLGWVQSQRPAAGN